MVEKLIRDRLLGKSSFGLLVEGDFNMDPLLLRVDVEMTVMESVRLLMLVNTVASVISSGYEHAACFLRSISSLFRALVSLAGNCIDSDYSDGLVSNRRGL